MERLELSILIVLCTIFPFRLNGQSEVGSKVGVNLSRFVVNESANVKSSVNAGFSLGNFYKYTFHEYKAIEIEIDIMFHYQTSAIEDLATNKTLDYCYIGMEIPVYGILQARFDHSKLYFGFGPFASVGFVSRLVSDNRSKDLYKKDKTANEAMLHRWDFGVGFILGYEFGFGLQINVNSRIGMRNLLDANSGKATMISQMLGMGLGYRF